MTCKEQKHDLLGGAMIRKQKQWFAQKKNNDLQQKCDLVNKTMYI